MQSSKVERRLAAIVAMDVVSYSRLMGVDEVGTHNTLKAHRSELIDPAIATHRGRLVKTTGDGLLLEFASVVDAIAFAVAVQRGMFSRNAAIAEDRRTVFRVGVNIGDIIIDQSDIFGDGVNVAARLEALCEPGGVCISRAANEQVRDKLSLSFADLGEHTVKNIARAVGVFGLSARDIASLPEIPIARPAEVIAAAVPRRHARVVFLLAASTIGLIAAAGAWWWNKSPSIAPMPTLEQRIAAQLVRSIPSAPAGSREEAAASYAKAPPHRAIAIAHRAGRSWWASNWPSREVAEDKALEKCQLAFDEPCALVGADEASLPALANGTWPVRDAPRVRYAGLFNPERIPALRGRDQQRADIMGYAASPGPKAMALHASGALGLVIGAATQRAAEERALAACNDDPQRRSSDIPCYLYAVENRVVLPLRSPVPFATTSPVTTSPPQSVASPAAPASVQSAGAVPSSGETALRAALLDVIAKAAPALSVATGESQVAGYLGAANHKAIAVAPPGNSWRSSGWTSAAIAEERVLEACQARYGQPCVVIVVNDNVRSAAADGSWPRRAMARVAYDGPFDPQQIPAVTEGVRQRPDIAGYRAKDGPKAASFHPMGRVFVVTNAASQRAAEAAALAACNADPARIGPVGPCLLYAVANDVVLPRRSTVPLSAAAD